MIIKFPAIWGTLVAALLFDSAYAEVLVPAACTLLMSLASVFYVFPAVLATGLVKREALACCVRRSTTTNPRATNRGQCQVCAFNIATASPISTCRTQ